MSFGDHLEELRRCIFRALIGVVVAAVITFYFGHEIVLYLQHPLHHVQRNAGLPAMTIGLSVTTGFAIYMKVSLISAAILASPWLVYQAWKFVAAGLYAQERRAAILVMPFSALMTGLGVSFAYYVMLPISLAFLINFATSYPEPGSPEPNFMDNLTSVVAKYAGRETDTPKPEIQIDPAADTDVFKLPVLATDPAAPTEGQLWINGETGEMKIYFSGKTRTLALAASSLMSPFIEIGQYMGFVMFLTLGVAVAFQLPLLMLIAGWSGFVRPSMITPYRRHCMFVCFVAGAILTPADPISMVVLAVPLILLFEFGLILMGMAAKTVPTKSDDTYFTEDD